MPKIHIEGNRYKGHRRAGTLLAASNVLAQQQPQLAVGVAQQELEARLRDSPLLCASALDCSPVEGQDMISCKGSRNALLLQ